MSKKTPKVEVVFGVQPVLSTGNVLSSVTSWVDSAFHIPIMMISQVEAARNVKHCLGTSVPYQIVLHA